MDKNTDRCDIETAIRGFIASHILYEKEFLFSDDASLLRERIIDSLGVVELAAFLGQRFGVRVEQAEIRPENFDSVSNLAAFVKRKQGLIRARSAVPV